MLTDQEAMRNQVFSNCAEEFDFEYLPEDKQLEGEINSLRVVTRRHSQFALSHILRKHCCSGELVVCDLTRSSTYLSSKGGLADPLTKVRVTGALHRFDNLTLPRMECFRDFSLLSGYLARMCRRAIGFCFGAQPQIPEFGRSYWVRGDENAKKFLTRELQEQCILNSLWHLETEDRTALVYSPGILVADNDLQSYLERVLTFFSVLSRAANEFHFP